MSSRMKASSLRLLLPPLRLLTAAVWQVIQQQGVKHYGILEEFVTLVTEAIPQLLTDRQRGLLLLALRAKVTLSNPADDQTHLERIRSVSEASHDEELTECCSTLLTLTNTLTETPADSQRLLQEVFNQSFDSALQSLVSDLLTRIEQLFPVPDFRQVASWLHDAPCVLEDSLQETDRKHLTELLTNQSCRLGRATTAVCGETEETLLSVWSHPLLTNPAHPNPASQSESGPPQLDMQLVKVEVELMTEDVTDQNMSEGEQEASNQSSEGGGVTPVAEDGDRWDRVQTPSVPVRMKESPGQSESFQLTAISHNSRRVAHRCPVCGKCFIYRSQVIRHLRSNRTCGSAGKPGSGALQDWSEEGPRPVRTHTCFQCGSTFTSRTELLTHRRTHLTRPVYRCNQCDSAFQLQSSLTNHKQSHRLPDLNCSVCAQTFSSQTRLLRHLQTHSAEGAECVYRCLFCDQSFSGVTQLRIHQRTHSSRSYQCDQCDKSYSSVTGLQSHRATHSSDNRFLCPQCGKCFKTCDGLEGHLRTHSGERPFRCPYCPKDFTAHAGLNVHMRQHTGEKPYVCTVCGKAWPSGGDLQKHMRTHTGERPYVCQECGKAFSISCHLTEHRRIHTGEKPFSCTECGKCFRRRFDLKKHLLSHSNIRPHPCTFCSKSYTRQTHLNRHLLTHRTADGEVEKEPVEEA
ncbi:uncharacterized protein FYW61_021736 [Anableps anableps]